MGSSPDCDALVAITMELFDTSSGQNATEGVRSIGSGAEVAGGAEVLTLVWFVLELLEVDEVSGVLVVGNGADNGGGKAMFEPIAAAQSSAASNAVVNLDVKDDCKGLGDCQRYCECVSIKTHNTTSAGTAMAAVKDDCEVDTAVKVGGGGGKNTMSESWQSCGNVTKNGVSK